MNTLIDLLGASVRRGTPMAFAAMGEALSERSGTLNLGVEGMMLVGAMTSVAAQLAFGSTLVSVLAAGLAASCLAALHALLVIRFRANQIVSGFALTVLGTGISGFLGRPLVGRQVPAVSSFAIPGLSRIPWVGPVLFEQDVLVYASYATALLLWLFLNRTRTGVRIRAIGEDPEGAFAQGVPVVRIRVGCTVFGGFLSGVGGAHLALAFAQVWAEKMTAGQGWIAVGLVIVAGWRPSRALPVAWLFGFAAVLLPFMQTWGVDISPFLVSMLPYVLAVAALVAATYLHRRRGYGVPSALAREL